jgi:hypothetical protein
MNTCVFDAQSGFADEWKLTRGKTKKKGLSSGFMYFKDYSTVFFQIFFNKQLRVTLSFSRILASELLFT